MPSIRRSLIGYFLLLLGLALGGVGLLVDRFAVETVRGREEAEARRIEQAYEVGAQKAEDDFNRPLVQQANALGRELRLRYFVLWFQDQQRDMGRGRGREPEEWEKKYRLGMAFLPVGGVGGSPWDGIVGLAAATNDRLRREVNWTLQRLHSDELVRQGFWDGLDGHPKYFQFHFPYAWRVIRHPNPGPGHALPDIPLQELNRNPTFHDLFEDVEAGNGEPVRRVIFKSPLYGGGPPPRGPMADPFRVLGALVGGVGGVTQMLPPVLLDRGFDPAPFVYVQAARPLSDLNAQLDKLKEKRDADLTNVADETRKSLTELRTTLGVIGGLTFVAVLAGGWLLVGRGLAPVRKLSDAVSRVSERDFKLPVPQSEMSVELVPIHARLTQTLDELRRAFEREKQAVADISHELRTPVAALLTTLDVTLRKPRSAEQYKATLEECRAIGKQLSKLVERVMTLASLDAGLDRAHYGPVDLADLATGCGTVIRPLAGAQELTLSLDIDPAAEVVTDPDKVREVVMNLLHNAVEYNRPGGDVSLAVRPTAGGGAVIEVRDTGIGMTPDVAGRIFERFYRADPSRHATGVHAGLGLSIVREYLDRLGGKVTVESEPGSGSTFRVILPAVAPGADGEPGPAV
jgi:signal transduction histidine kinase